MWRSYHEDWERKKTYLVRSLFQDIPLLSPVPEDGESRLSYSPSRPYSPLPPLTIEKIPNRHDHPPEFYDKLERKMKKLYRKLFFNEGSSSLEELLQDDPDARSLSHKVRCRQISSESMASTPSSDRSHSPLIGADDINNTSRSDKQPDVEPLLNLEETSDSDESDVENLVITQADVHDIPAQIDRHLQTISPVNDSDRCSSPILVLKSKTHGMKMNDEESSESEEETTLKRFDSASKNGKSDKRNESVEIMRTQRLDSLSLGSLQHDLSVTVSSIVDVGFKRKTSLVSDEDEGSLYEEAGGMQNIRSSETIPKDAWDVLSPPTICDDRSSNGTNFSNTFIKHHDVDSTVVKRRKFENIALQTSMDEETLIDWNNVKNNFFVGVPKIYKLCACSDHTCITY